MADRSKILCPECGADVTKDALDGVTMEADACHEESADCPECGKTYWLSVSIDIEARRDNGRFAATQARFAELRANSAVSDS